MKVLGLILLIVSTKSFLVYEKIPLNTYIVQVKKELNEIGALHGLEEAELSDFEYTKDSITYSLDSVKSKAVFFNVNMLSASVDTQYGTILSLDWTAKTGETNYISPYHSVYRAYISKNSNSLKTTLYEIEFELEVSKFKFTKSWEYNEDSFYSSKGNIDNTYVAFKVKNLEDDSPFSEDIILEVVNAFLTARKTEMNEAFTNYGVDAYYKSLPFESLVQKVYTQTSTNIANENNIDLTLEVAPEYTSNSDFIFKRKGKLNDLDIDGSPIITDTSSYQKFNINKNLIKNLISQNLFNIVFEQTNNPSSQYELTGTYLKQIMDISITDSTELKVLAEMDSVEFNDANAISGIAYFTVNIISKSDFSIVLDFTMKISFVFTPTLFQNGLNFVLLAKNLNIEEIKPTQTVRNQDLLMSWIKNTYLVSLGNHEFNLFSLSFDLSHYFSSNKLTYEFKDDYLSIIKQ